MSKVIRSWEQAVMAAGVKDGMTISFHHHLRNGDLVVNRVLEELEKLGVKDLHLDISSIHRVHAPLIDHVASGLIRSITTSYMDGEVGRYFSAHPMDEPIRFTTHGGRGGEIADGKVKIDVAFVAASVSDCEGNCSGKYGKSAFGSLGYGLIDARYADKVVVITDTLADYPLADLSIPETEVDLVALVDSIGDPEGISSGTTKPSRNPVYLQIAGYAAEVIAASGLLKDGFSFQGGASGIALSVAGYLKERMLAGSVHGSFALGGITGTMVDMLGAGCFEALLDVQDFDIRAARSLQSDPRHREIDAVHYSYIPAKSCAVKMLDAAVLGATEIDVNFDVNVHTDSFGRIMGGSGGHSDIAAGSKLTVIAAPLIRGRIPVVVEKVRCVSTVGGNADVLVTQYGIAVNPRRQDLKDALRRQGLPVRSINDLAREAVRLTGVPDSVPSREQIVARVLSPEGELTDTIHAV